MLENTGLAVWVRESPSIFSYTLVLSLHAIGIATVIGISVLVALRVLGKAPAIPLSSLQSLYPVLKFGFLINLVSGLLLFLAGATNMGTMAMFWIKMTFVVAGMVIGFRLKSQYLDRADHATAVVPRGGRKLAWLSLGCWLCALVAGRLTGYPHFIASLFGT